jgi:hypothetical protein
MMVLVPSGVTNKITAILSDLHRHPSFVLAFRCTGAGARGYIRALVTTLYGSIVHMSV